MIKDNLIFGIGILVGLIVISVSGFLYYKSKGLGIRDEGLASTTTIATPVATIKPQEVSYKDKVIEVLNGSGVKGLAKIYADKLTALGYTKVTTGNYKEIVTKSILFAPTDFGNELNLENYTFEKSDSIKVVISK